MPRLPGLIRPMMATLGPLPQPPGRDGDWGFELKWDGVRAVAYVDGGSVRLLSRTDRDQTVSYPELAGLAAAIDRPVVLDGEIVAFDAGGRPSFSRLAHRIQAAVVTPALRASIPVHYLLFDVLHLDGESMLGRTFAARRAEAWILRRVVGDVRHPTASVRGRTRGRGSLVCPMWTAAGRTPRHPIASFGARWGLRRWLQPLLRRPGDLRPRPARLAVAGCFHHGLRLPPAPSARPRWAAPGRKLGIRLDDGSQRFPNARGHPAGVRPRTQVIGSVSGWRFTSATCGSRETGCGTTPSCALTTGSSFWSPATDSVPAPASCRRWRPAIRSAFTVRSEERTSIGMATGS